MHGIPLAALARRILVCLVVVFTNVVAVSALAADPRVESDAKALEKKAIEEDFLNVDYASAIKKLQTAVTKCGGDKCSPAVKGAVLRDLGAMQILAGNNDEGRASFAQALATDPSLELDPSYKNPQLEAVWADVKKKGGGAAAGGGAAGGAGAGGAAVGPQPSGDFTHTPAPEQAARTPLPIYVEYPGTENIAKVIVKYKGFGMTDWKPLDLPKLGDGWGGLIPCKDVMQGPMQYYIQGFNAANDPVATSGSRNKPYTVPIKQSISGAAAAPSLPGQEPPKQCSELTGAECPPDFPGCNNKKASGEDCDKDDQCTSGACVGGKCAEKKSGGEDCESDDQCASGTCSDGKCTESKKGEGEDCESDDECDSGSCKEGKCGGGGGKFPRIWIGIGAQVDVFLLPGANDVCILNGYQPNPMQPASPGNGTGPFTSGNPYGCVDPNTSANFPGGGANGPPTNNAIVQGKSDQVQGGFAHGPLHLLASFDYALNKNMLVGARAGYELLTNPASGGVVTPAFAPVHIEARFTYLIGKDALLKPLSPMLFAGFGAGEFDAMVPVQVVCKMQSGACANQIQPENAWITAGPVFASVGGGVRLAFGQKKNIAIPLGVRLQAAFGGSAGSLLGFAPEAGIQLGF